MSLFAAHGVEYKEGNGDLLGFLLHGAALLLWWISLSGDPRVYVCVCLDASSEYI